MYQALWSFLVCVVVTVVVSLVTKPVPDSELTGLVYGLTEIPSIGDVPLIQNRFLGGCGGGGHFRRAEHYFLVSGSHPRERGIGTDSGFDLVFHRHFAGG
jgi:hypothetical protein